MRQGVGRKGVTQKDTFNLASKAGAFLDAAPLVILLPKCPFRHRSSQELTNHNTGVTVTPCWSQGYEAGETFVEKWTEMHSVSLLYARAVWF